MQYRKNARLFGFMLVIGATLSCGVCGVRAGEECKPARLLLPTTLPPEDTQTPRNTEMLSVQRVKLIVGLDSIARNMRLIPLEFAIRNLTDKSLTFTESASWYDYKLRVYKVTVGPDGITASTPAPLTEEGRKKLLEPQVFSRFYLSHLPPGAAKQGCLLVGNLFDMTQPGTYSISVSCYANPKSYVSADEQPLLLVAPPVIVEIQ